nr:hypothetical protein KitaXyl93_51880 [Kitasatospora sp. Xyl93]
MEVRRVRPAAEAVRRQDRHRCLEALERIGAGETPLSGTSEDVPGSGFRCGGQGTIEVGDRYWKRMTEALPDGCTEAPAPAVKDIGVRTRWCGTGAARRIHDGGPAS